MPTNRSVLVTVELWDSAPLGTVKEAVLRALSTAFYPPKSITVKEKK